MSAIIDLSSLDSPDVVELLDFETIFAAMLADLRSRDATFDALVESDPAYKILEVCAYRELLLRQRVNDAARSVMLAYAGGADLDHLAALLGVERLVVDPGDQEAVPPTGPVYESDDSLRVRVQLSPESLSVAGPRGAYIYHALSTDSDVLDVAVESPAPGQVLVTVLSAKGDGTPDTTLLEAVDAALSAEDVRPLTDQVIVQGADVVPFGVQAGLTLYDGPDSEAVRQAAYAAVVDYVTRNHRIGRDIALSGLYAALHQPGVQHVTLNAPMADIVISAQQAPYCTGVTVTVEGTDE